MKLTLYNKKAKPYIVVRVQLPSDGGLGNEWIAGALSLWLDYSIDGIKIRANCLETAELWTLGLGWKNCITGGVPEGRTHLTSLHAAFSLLFVCCLAEQLRPSVPFFQDVFALPWA